MWKFLYFQQMAFKFESLNIWQKSMELTIEISDLAKCFPSFELYSLSSQIRRAADWVVLNIAEGCTGQSNAEFRKFLRYSLRLAIEVVSCLFIARNKRYLNDESFNKYYSSYEILSKMINKFSASLAP